MEMLARATADYLNMQIAAGADIVQLFDSWVGSLGPDDYRRFVLPHSAVGDRGDRARDVPVIHFGTVTGNLLELMREAGGDVIGLDWRVDLAEAWARLGLQRRACRAISIRSRCSPASPKFAGAPARFSIRPADAPGHIFNLGHGILPETPVDHVIALVDAVHEMSRKCSGADAPIEGNECDAPYGAVILIGFGGPTRAAEVRPFLDRVSARPADSARALRGSRASLRSDRRALAVQRDHGASGRGAARAAARDEDANIPVVVGMRNANRRRLSTRCARLSQRGVRRVLGFISRRIDAKRASERYQATSKSARERSARRRPMVDLSRRRGMTIRCSSRPRGVASRARHRAI